MTGVRNEMTRGIYMNIDTWGKVNSHDVTDNERTDEQEEYLKAKAKENWGIDWPDCSREDHIRILMQHKQRAGQKQSEMVTRGHFLTGSIIMQLSRITMVFNNVPLTENFQWDARTTSTLQGNIYYFPGPALNHEYYNKSRARASYGFLTDQAAIIPNLIVDDLSVEKDPNSGKDILVIPNGKFARFKYIAVIESTLLPMLLRENASAVKNRKSSLITMQAIGCGQSAGFCSGALITFHDGKVYLPQLFLRALVELLKKHHEKLSNIKAIIFLQDPDSCPEEQIQQIGKNGLKLYVRAQSKNNPLGLCNHPAEYGSEYRDCQVAVFADIGLREIPSIMKGEAFSVRDPIYVVDAEGKSFRLTGDRLEKNHELVNFESSSASIAAAFAAANANPVIVQPVPLRAAQLDTVATKTMTINGKVVSFVNGTRMADGHTVITGADLAASMQSAGIFGERDKLLNQPKAEPADCCKCTLV